MQDETMRMINTSGDLLLAVVNDVLDYSKLESGNLDIEIKPSSLQETLNSVVQAIETQGQSKKISVRTFYDAAVGEFIKTDSRRLQQILYNLLGNAVKFSKEGGVVELSVSVCPSASGQNGNSYSPAEADIETGKVQKDEEQVLLFVVKDYGKGIKKRTLRRSSSHFSKQEQK